MLIFRGIKGDLSKKRIIFVIWKVEEMAWIGEFLEVDLEQDWVIWGEFLFSDEDEKLKWRVGRTHRQDMSIRIEVENVNYPRYGYGCKPSKIKALRT